MKRQLALILAGALALSLVGCSNQGGGSTASQAGESSQASVASSDGSGETQEIVFWNHETDTPRMAAMQSVLDAFNESHPGISVRQEAVTWDDEQAKTLLAISTNSTPDFSQTVEANWTPAYLAGGLTPVDEIIEMVDEEQGYLEGCKDIYLQEGHYWAVPYASTCGKLMYRPSLLKEAGYDAPPQTWDELLDMAKTLNKDTDGDGTIDIYGVGITASRSSITQETFFNLLHSAEGNLYDEDGNVDFDNETTLKTLKFYKELCQYTVPSYAAWGWGEYEMNWAAGEFAINPWLSPNLADFYANENYDIASAPLPAPEGIEPGGNFAAHHGFMVFKSAAEDEEHWAAVKEFFSFLMQPENNWNCTVACAPGHIGPVTQSLTDLIAEGYYNEEYFPLENFDYSDGSEQRETFETFMEVFPTAVAKGYSPGYKYGLNNTSLGDIYNSYVVADMIQKVVLENADPQETLTWAQKQMEDISASTNQ